MHRIVYLLNWRSHRSQWITLCLVLALTWGIAMSGVLSRIDNVIYDGAQKSLPRSVPEDVVLVTIDEQSLYELGRWPWSRRLHAQLINRLHGDGALVIGLDLILSEPQHDDPLADTLLARAIADAGNVVMPVVIENTRANGQLIETLPMQIFAEQVAGLGRVHAELDADAIARSIMLWEGVEEPTWPHFAQTMLTAAGQLPENHPSKPPKPTGSMMGLAKHDQRYINFSSAQKHLLSMPYVQVLNGEFVPGTFRNKLVLIGASASGMADSLTTPVSGYQQPMPGVEFLGNALISMREGSLIWRVPLSISVLIACLLAVIPVLWLPYLSPRLGLLVNFSWALLVMLVAIVLPMFAQMWVPLSSAFAGIFSAYPIWAWHKLEANIQFMDAELARLHSELANISVDGEALQSVKRLPAFADPFLRRITQIRQATDSLKLHEQHQHETLAFVSHDIRTPLAAALIQVGQTLGEQHPAYKQLTIALAWTEDYLQTTRAQILRPEAFTELDLDAVLQEVANEIQPLLTPKKLTLKAHLINDPVFILGDKDILTRSIFNILTNAIKYSDENKVIYFSAQTQDKHTLVSVTDQGPGISPENIERLFKRYSRLSRDIEHYNTGVGLGLFFVHTVMEKHGGHVRVHSDSSGTTFTLHFPLSSVPM